VVLHCAATNQNYSRVASLLTVLILGKKRNLPTLGWLLRRVEGSNTDGYRSSRVVQASHARVLCKKLELVTERASYIDSAAELPQSAVRIAPAE